MARLTTKHAAQMAINDDSWGLGSDLVQQLPGEKPSLGTKAPASLDIYKHLWSILCDGCTGVKVIDIGCASGEAVFAACFLAAIAHVIGIDPALMRLKFALSVQSRAWKHPDLPRLMGKATFRQANAGNVDQMKALGATTADAIMSFDKVFSDNDKVRA